MAENDSTTWYKCVSLLLPSSYKDNNEINLQFLAKLKCIDMTILHQPIF